MYLSEVLEGLLTDFQPNPAHINTDIAVSCRQLLLLLLFLCCSASHLNVRYLKVIISCTGQSHLQMDHESYKWLWNN